MEFYDNEIDQWLNELREFGLEYVSRRYYSNYHGIVTEVNDPQEQGRIRVKVSELGHDETLSVWAYPSASFAGDNYGIYFPPEIGDTVWIWFHLGDPSQPRYIGGWWRNPDDKKLPGTSHIPTEFKNPTGAAPSTRGIKTKKGHGMLFEDSDLGPMFEIWTGKNNGPQLPAIKHHRLFMTDEPGNEFASLNTFKGHELFMDDVDGLEQVFLKTAGGHVFELIDQSADRRITLQTLLSHRLTLNDVDKSITIDTAQGHSLTFSDIDNSIILETVTGKRLVLDDSNKMASLETPTQSVKLNDSSGSIEVTTSGNVIVNTAGNVTVNSAGAISSTSTTSSITTGVMNLTAGVASLTFLGAMTLIATGIITIGGPLTTAIMLTVGSASGVVSLGLAGGVFKKLVHEEIVNLHNSHTHNFVGNLGAPGVTSTPTTPIDPDTVTTKNTAAN